MVSETNDPTFHEPFPIHACLCRTKMQRRPPQWTRHHISSMSMYLCSNGTSVPSVPIGKSNYHRERPCNDSIKYPSLVNKEDKSIYFLYRRQEHTRKDHLEYINDSCAVKWHGNACRASVGLHIWTSAGRPHHRITRNTNISTQPPIHHMSSQWILPPHWQSIAPRQEKQNTHNEIHSFVVEQTARSCVCGRTRSVVAVSCPIP